MTLKEEKFFCGTHWYHGTNLSGWKSICKLGVKADYNVGISLDFGSGFYLFNTLENTSKYARNVVKYTKSIHLEDKIPVVILFSFCPMKWIEEGQLYHYFAKYDEFAEFVFANRLNCVEPKKHPYDITAGVTTDAKPTWLMQQYVLGKITQDKVMEELKRNTSVKQICLHGRQCDEIKPVKAFILDGKELDVNDYCNKG